MKYQIKHPGFLLMIVIALALLLPGAAYSEEPGKQSEQPQESQGINWDDPNSISADDLIKNPAEAINNWDKLPADKKEDLYKQAGSLSNPQFAQKFAQEKGIKGADFSAGNVEYDGQNVKNGDVSININELQGANVNALADGGFDISFAGSKKIGLNDFTLPTGGSVKVNNDNSINIPTGAVVTGGFGTITAKGDVTFSDNLGKFSLTGPAVITSTTSYPVNIENREGTLEYSWQLPGGIIAAKADNAKFSVKDGKGGYELDGKWDVSGGVSDRGKIFNLYPYDGGKKQSSLKDFGRLDDNKDDMLFTSAGKPFEIHQGYMPAKEKIYEPQDSSKAVAYYEGDASSTGLAVKGAGEFQGFGYKYKGEHDSAILNGKSYKNFDMGTGEFGKRQNLFNIDSSIGVIVNGELVKNTFEGSLAKVSKIMENGKNLEVDFVRSSGGEIRSKIGDLTQQGEGGIPFGATDSFTTENEHLVLAGNKVFHLADSTKFNQMDLSDNAIDNKLDLDNRLHSARVESSKTTFGKRKEYFDPLTGKIINIEVSDDSTGKVYNIDPRYAGFLDEYTGLLMEKTESGKLNEFQKDQLADTYIGTDNLKQWYGPVGSSSNVVDNVNKDIKEVANQVLSKHFTPKAIKALKDVNVVQRDLYAETQGLTKGVEPDAMTQRYLSSSWFGLFTDMTYDIVVNDNPSTWGLENIVTHEFIHVAKEEGLINENNFNRGYERMQNDPEYAPIIQKIDNQIGSNYNNPEVIHERMAYMGQFMNSGQVTVPDYMKDVYKDVLVSAAN